ncbi:MAG: phenylalanine--tRNA ligase subunit beta [Deltaproteobacteria bacterium GWA2_57_13]|nr:MAG: phenylalanine--tRNA ligase subunit beta [Deltaproteobacteria bacterium GWA2_57_13]
MKFTFSWLREFVDVKKSPQETAYALTMAGLEVESLASLGGQEDWVMEVAVTPNRGDCLGILGLAREVAALTGGRLKLPPVLPHVKGSGMERLVDVQIRSPSLCPRYSARMVLGVRVADSPDWMRVRLEVCGIRAINNVVDVTNYVMLETGQPLHAFDADRLATKRIVVREAGGIAKLVTLDGTERELAPGDLLICDGDAPIALAGVMGGKDSEVQWDTHTVLLEGAHFDPACVRRTAKRLAIHSEASHRFERGVDPEGTLYALDRAVFLLAEAAGGVPVKGMVDRYPRRVKATPIVLREKRVSGLLGIELSRREAERLLKSLGMQVQSRSKIGARVVPPSYRRDLTREADLIEELARLHGYEKIPSTLPWVRPVGAGYDFRLQRERKVRAFLLGEGLTEMINLPFTSVELNRRFYGLWGDRGAAVSILNPLAQDKTELRLSLIPGLLENLRANLAQKARSFYAFDLGKVFCLNAQRSAEEKQYLAALLCGARGHRGLRLKEELAPNLRDAKGLVEGILEVLGIEAQPTWSGVGVGSFLHPGKAAVFGFGEREMGCLGEVHPDLCEELGLAPFLVVELDFEGLVQYAPRRLAARPLPRFPSVERDLAVVVDGTFPAQRIVSWIKELNHSLIEDVQVFDEYRGSPIPEGKKSLAYTISYRAEDRTLTDAEVNQLHHELAARIGDVFRAKLRG